MVVRRIVRSDVCEPKSVAYKYYVRYHESIDNLTPADIYSGRAETILAERKRNKRKTIANRRLQHRLQAA
jgi:RNA-directed DNA polymerase